MNALEIKDLTKKYKNFNLDTLNLTLPSGCIMGLIGENGAGKSTTIKLILNAIKKDSGTISILGKDSTKYISEIKEDIGVVLDEPGFPDCLTASQINNVMRYSYKNWNEKVFFGYLQKLDIPQKKEFKNFSRGMKMKLSIAVALSHNAKLLILDEATNGLDPVIRNEVVEMFNEFTRDETHAVLISSHIVSDLEKICDYIAFLHNGKLMLCEEKDLLTEQYGIINCTKEQFLKLPSNSIKGKKKGKYGIEAIVKRSEVPKNITINPVSIEELFIFMSKEYDK